jgi:hypothetical protein
MKLEDLQQHVEMTTMQLINKVRSKTINKNIYYNAAKAVKKYYDDDKSNDHTLEYHAAKVIDHYGLNVDARILADIVRNVYNLKR